MKVEIRPEMRAAWNDEDGNHPFFGDVPAGALVKNGKNGVTPSASGGHDVSTRKPDSGKFVKSAGSKVSLQRKRKISVG